MRRVVAWFVDALPFDLRSRRAIDETLADWAHEEREQLDAASRISVDIRSALSVARVATLALVREAGDFDWTRGLARRARVAIGISTALGFAFSLLAFGGGLGSWAWLVGLAMVPMTLLFLVPPAIVLGLAWRPMNSAAVPTVGAASFVALATLCFASVLMPVSSSLMVAATAEGLRDMAKAAGVDFDGLGSSRPWPTGSAWMWVLAGLTSAVLAAAGTFFAAAQRKRAPLTNAWWLVGVPVAYLVSLKLVQFAIGLTLFALGVLGPTGGRDLREVNVLREAITGSTGAALFLIGAIVYGHLAVRGPDGPAVTLHPTD